MLAQKIYEHYFEHVVDPQFRIAKVREIESWLEENYDDIEWSHFRVASAEITLEWGKIATQTWPKLVEQVATIPALRAALEGLLEGYCDIVDSGDMGFHDKDIDPLVIAARSALAVGMEATL